MNDQNSSKPTNGSSLLAVVKQNWRGLYVLVALGVDWAAIICSNVVAHEVYSHLSIARGLAPPFFMSSLLFVVVFSFFGSLLGLYRAAYHTKIGEQYLIGGKVYLNCVGLILAFLFVTGQIDYPRLYLVLFFATLPLVFYVFRALMNTLNKKMQGQGFGIFHTLVLEYDHRHDEEVVDRFANLPELGYRIRSHKVRQPKAEEYSSGKALDQLSRIVDSERIDSILIPTVDIISDGYSELISLCERKKMKLKVLSEEWEDLLRFVHVRDIAGITLYMPPKRKTARIKKFLKRGFDVTGALIMILILSPLFAAVSLAILLEDGRPVFFKQKVSPSLRAGEFPFLKFRSMIKNAEEKQRELYKDNKRTGGLFLVTDDPRVTRVGKLIRKSSVDELPQLINVVKGEMSLVGPRPLSMGDLSNISPDNSLGGYYTLREQAKPGMTGLWQICGRREIDFREMVLLDLYYIEHQTIIFDLEILFHTIPVVLFGKGAY